MHEPFEVEVTEIEINLGTGARNWIYVKPVDPLPPGLAAPGALRYGWDTPHEIEVGSRFWIQYGPTEYGMGHRHVPAPKEAKP